MYSVFSQSLIDRWKLYYKAQHRRDVPRDLNLKLNDVLDWFISHDKLEYMPQVLYVHKIVILDYIAEEASYKVITTPELQKIVRWICKNILMKMRTDNLYTINVRIRIAVDMLNKLEHKGIIDKDLNLFFFDNVVTNIQDMWWELTSDDLPF